MAFGGTFLWDFTLRTYDQDTRRFLRTVFRPFRPPFVRATEMVLLQVELIQLDREASNPQFLTQIPNGLGVVVILMSVT